MRVLKIVAAAAMALGMMGTAQAANLLTNGSFEAQLVTAADISCLGAPWCIRSFGSTPGWTQFNDGVDLVHNNYTQPLPIPVLVDASDGVNFLDMNQANLLGGIFQTVVATAGQRFNLSLDTTAWVANGLGGVLGYELFDPGSNAVLASGSYQDNSGGAWITRSLSAVATSSSIGVRIQALASTQAGPGLDNVILTAVPGGVPEPASWALMIAGFGLIGSAMRRRAKARGQSFA